MYGIDISIYQSGIDLAKGTYDFAIIKATEGVGFADKSFYKFAVQLTELNKLIGCYHFARPDLHITTCEMENEADWFVQKVKEANLLGKAILILDWEREPTNRPDLVKAWVLRVESQTGIVPFIYGSRSKMKQWYGWWAMGHCPIWMASWPNLKRYEAGADPGLSLPDKAINWSIWQYSSTGYYPGFSGNIDLDYCDFDRDTWLKMAGHNSKPKEKISEDMKWAIENGLFLGHTDGTFRPSEPVTRDQLAKVLARYTRYINTQE